MVWTSRCTTSEGILCRYATPQTTAASSRCRINVAGDELIDETGLPAVLAETLYRRNLIWPPERLVLIVALFLNFAMGLIRIAIKRWDSEALVAWSRRRVPSLSFVLPRGRRCPL